MMATGDGDPIPHVDHRVHGGGWLDACAGDARERIAACLSLCRWLSRWKRLVV